MADQFVMCARAEEDGVFKPEPGPTQYLLVPDGATPSPRHAIGKNEWVKRLRGAAVWGKDERDPTRQRGDLLVFIHGYNNDQDIVMQRHATLSADLKQAGFRGVVMSFDWPSDDKALNYMEDRHDAKLTSMQLVSDGIAVLSEQQSADCTINIHLLAHSTGAYVIREAFDDADDARLANNAWTVSQIALIGGDVSVTSMSASDSASDSIYRHCTRLTNYSNLMDSVLKLSNAKRLGVAPRVGRNGLPADAPAKAVNVDCTEYFQLLNGNDPSTQNDQDARLGSFDHSWHIGNKVFARDLFETLRGNLDRSVIPTRARGPNGQLKLIRGE